VSAGNWGNGLAVQLAPNETSIGWWRVGPRAAPYGRFARGFHAASGRTAMSFVLDERLWGGLPLPAARGVALTLRLVYFDAGGGLLTLAYDAAGGCTAAATVPVNTAPVVLTPWTKVPAAAAPTAPGAWAEMVVNITDAYFGRRCGPRGADIVLSSTADSIVHGFEVYRTGGGGAPPAPPSTASPTAPPPTASATPTPTPTRALAASRAATSSPSPAMPALLTPTPAASLTSSPSASLGAAGVQGAEGAAATSASAGPGLAVIVAPIAAGCACALAAAALVCRLRRRRRAARVAALVTHGQRVEQRVANPASVNSWRAVNGGVVSFADDAPGATGALAWTLSPQNKTPPSAAPR